MEGREDKKLRQTCDGLLVLCSDGNDDDDENNGDNGTNNAHPHLHVLPPHGFSYAIRTPSETLC